MERLTKRISENIIELSARANPIQYNGSAQRVHIKHPFWNVFNKLCDYEDAEEQGLLYRKIFYIGNYCHQPGDCPLNCEYCSDNYLEVKDSVVEINRIHIYGEIGKTVFLNKEEAEQALARMEGENV